MKNIILSGLRYCKTNFMLMDGTLRGHGIHDNVDFGSYQSYQSLDDENLVQQLNDHFDDISSLEKVNLICHSMGCNVGLILARERSSQIGKAVFLSPELYSNSRLEKRRAKLRVYRGEFDNDFSIAHHPKQGIFSSFQLYKVFKQTRKMAQESLDDICHLNSFIIYGAADRFVSPEGASKLADKLKGSLCEVNTQYHNVLLSQQGNVVANKVYEFLKQ